MALQTDAIIADLNGNNQSAELSGKINELVENGELQFGELIDSASVYATFNPVKNPNLLLGCQYSRYQITMDNSDPDSNNINITSVNFQNYDAEPVNIRYVAPETGRGNIDGSLIMNWQMNDSEKELYLQCSQLTTGSLSFKAPFTGNTNFIGNSQYQYNTLNYRYYLDMDRSSLMYKFFCNFFYIDAANNIVTLTIPEADVIAHLKSDDETFIYNGNEVYPYYLNINSVSQTARYLWKDNTRSAIYTRNQPYFMIERYFGDKLAHIYTGISTSLNANQYLGFVHNGFTVNWQSKNTYQNAIYNGQLTNNSSYGYTALPDGNSETTYLQGFTPYPLDTTDIQFDDDLYQNYEPPTNTNNRIIYKRGNYFYILQNVSRSTLQRGKTLTISPVITLKDVCRQFALTLIPFCYSENINTFPNTSNYVLIGIRDSENAVSGEYVEYDWDNPQTETSFRPEDFVPLVPKPITPEESDKGTTITGDSQSLRAPTNLTGCSGFLTHYVLTATQLANFGSALWANFNDSKFWQALGAVLTDSLSINPADILNYIVSLRCYPVDLISSGISTTDKLYIGRGTVGIDLGGSVAYNTDMTLFKSCGSVTVPQLYRNYLDYAPYTTISLYLPFCGEFELNATEVSGATLTVHYAIDFTTGICTAYVINAFDGVEYIILTASGQIGQELQLTAGNFAPVAYSLARAAIGGLSAELTGGLAAESVAGTVAGTVGGFAKGVASNIASGLYPARMNAGASFNAFYAPMTPYLKIRSSRQSKSSNWNSTSGNITTRARYISELSGLIFCINPDCTGIPATTEEINQIKTLLENGIHV
ncbi:MAG: hypothetical protein HDS66_03445 [Bacteroidales bacterium]|nr:hypothetical protein [Bacteroidales bacterium]